MVVGDLIQEKNALLLSLEDARRQRKNRDVINLASLAAALEGRIARELVLADRVTDAVVNYISEASCLKDANRLVEAKRILGTAVSLAQGQSAEKWIREQLRTIPDSYQDPATIFRDLPVNIQGNSQTSTSTD